MFWPLLPCSRTGFPWRWIVRVSNEPGAFGGADVEIRATAVCAALR
jgi:hypothetical protein